MENSSRKKAESLRHDLLRLAAVDFRFLQSRSYPRKSALNFVGNRYQLDSVERNLLYRGIFSREISRKRRSIAVSTGELKGERLIIDGYNCLITLENAMKGTPVVLADDGFVRDTGLVFRKFRASELTRRVWSLVSGLLGRYPPSFTLLLLDAPYAKSGELCASINRWMETDGIEGRARTVTRNETAIAAMDGIKASADSVIIDHADRVFDLSGHIIRRILRKKVIRV